MTSLPDVSQNNTNLEPKKPKRGNILEPSPANLGFFFFSVFVLVFVSSFTYFNYETALGASFPRLVSWMGSSSSNGRLRVVSEAGCGNGRPGFLEKGGEDCDIFDGNWVWDESYPLYKSVDCPFLDGGFRCYGRPNNFATKWRWQPKSCNLPRFFYLINLFIFEKTVRGNMAVLGVGRPARQI